MISLKILTYISIYMYILFSYYGAHGLIVIVNDEIIDFFELIVKYCKSYAGFFVTLHM